MKYAIRLIFLSLGVAATVIHCGSPNLEWGNRGNEMGYKTAVGDLVWIGSGRGSLLRCTGKNEKIDKCTIEPWAHFGGSNAGDHRRGNQTV